MSDLIDRQKAIDTLSFFKERLNHHLGETDFREEERAWGLSLIQYCMDFIRQMPPAEPKKGTNIYYKAKGHCEFKCSICGAEAGVVEGRDLDGGHFAYCPNCGAKMEEENE